MANFLITLAPVPFESADDLLAKAKQSLKECFITSRTDGSNAVLVLSPIPLGLGSCDLILFPWIMGVLMIFFWLFQHAFCIEPYLPRELGKDPSNRRLYEPGSPIVNISDIAKTRTRNLSVTSVPTPIGQCERVLLHESDLAAFHCRSLSHIFQISSNYTCAFGARKHFTCSLQKISVIYFVQILHISSPNNVSEFINIVSYHCISIVFDRI